MIENQDSRRGCGCLQHNGGYVYTTDQHGFRVYSPPAQITGVEKQYRAALKTQSGIIQKTIMDEKKSVIQFNTITARTSSDTIKM